MSQPLPLLTIAGSDSGGAAGLQADLKTWAALGANGPRLHGMSAITAVTAQNSARVAAVHYLPPAMVAAQIDAVLSDYSAVAIKTGFLGRVEMIEVVAERLAYWGGERGLATRATLVVDPVLVNHRGEAMFGAEVAEAYRALLFPLADLVTPNRWEADLLQLLPEAQGSGGAGEQGGWKKMGSGALTPRLLLKGWERNETEIVDLYGDGRTWQRLPQPRVATNNLHGSGDTLSAAICAFVARGFDWPDAIRRAQAFTHAAIVRGAPWHLGAGHGPVQQF